MRSREKAIVKLDLQSTYHVFLMCFLTGIRKLKCCPLGSVPWKRKLLCQREILSGHWLLEGDYEFEVNEVENIRVFFLYHPDPERTKHYRRMAACPCRCSRHNNPKLAVTVWRVPLRPMQLLIEENGKISYFVLLRFLPHRPNWSACSVCRLWLSVQSCNYLLWKILWKQ